MAFQSRQQSKTIYNFNHVMLKIYSGTGSVHQEISINELILKYSDILPLIKQPEARDNLLYGRNEIEYECKTILIDSESENFNDDDKIDFDEEIFVCFEINYKLSLKKSFDSDTSFPDFITEIHLWRNDQKLPTEWPKSVHTIDLGNNTQELPTEWPKSVHTIDLWCNDQKLPTEWPKSVHTIYLGGNTQKIPAQWPKSVHTIDLGYNTQKLPTEWPKSVHTIDLRDNKQELPTEWPKSVHTIYLGNNTQELPDEWPKSVHTISINKDSSYLRNLLSDMRLEKMSEDKYNTYFKLKAQ